ncbi:hypothetical protein JB92DRAFT_722689 [Gautieria morchelliformis]|nr:hypothetical protein JB92DRAFT_722689 [Gautieria morchelliformis]
MCSLVCRSWLPIWQRRLLHSQTIVSSFTQISSPCQVHSRAAVNYLLRPLSLGELSLLHVKTLRIALVAAEAVDVINGLLRAIGSSLKHLELHYLPDRPVVGVTPGTRPH